MATVPAEKDYRALIAVILLILTGVVAIYGMMIRWTMTDILGLMAFFGPMDTAAVTYYFSAKQSEAVNRSLSMLRSQQPPAEEVKPAS